MFREALAFGRVTMTLQQLRYVVEIFHCGSITAAAQKLFVTQPSISRAIRDLESEIGVTILERNPGGVSFTADGLELLVYAKSILEQASSMKMRFLNSKENEMLRLTVSVQHYIFPIDAMINFVNQRLAETPSFTINLRDGNTSQVVKDVLSQHSEIGILYVSNATGHFMHQLFQKNDLEFHPMGTFSPQVYLRRGHPLAGYSAISSEQLLPYPCVRYESGGDLFNFAEEIIVLEDTSKCIFVTDRSALFSFLRCTDAYGIGSGCLLPHVIGPDIVSIPLQDRTEGMQIGWIKLKNTVIQPQMEEYIHFMESSLRKCSGPNCSLN